MTDLLGILVLALLLILAGLDLVRRARRRRALRSLLPAGPLVFFDGRRS